MDVAAAEKGKIIGKHGYEVKVDKAFDEIDPAGCAVLVLPGGKAPTAIRNELAVKSLVRAFFDADKPVGAICHGPQVHRFRRPGGRPSGHLLPGGCR